MLFVEIQVVSFLSHHYCTCVDFHLLSYPPRQCKTVIWNANQVLSWVLDPNTGGIHPALFGPSLLGIAFINVVEAGFVFSGNVGTGVVMARDEKTGKWSPPSAIGLTGIGWGFIMGYVKRGGRR